MTSYLQFSPYRLIKGQTEGVKICEKNVLSYLLELGFHCVAHPRGYLTYIVVISVANRCETLNSSLLQTASHVRVIMHRNQGFSYPIFQIAVKIPGNYHGGNARWTQRSNHTQSRSKFSILQEQHIEHMRIYCRSIRLSLQHHLQ